jgi:hypothetical protein
MKIATERKKSKAKLSVRRKMSKVVVNSSNGKKSVYLAPRTNDRPNKQNALCLDCRIDQPMSMPHWISMRECFSSCWQRDMSVGHGQWPPPTHNSLLLNDLPPPLFFFKSLRSRPRDFLSLSLALSLSFSFSPQPVLP